MHQVERVERALLGPAHHVGARLENRTVLGDLEAISRSPNGYGDRAGTSTHLTNVVSGLDWQQQARSLPLAAGRGDGVRAQCLLKKAAEEVEVEAERDRHRQGEQPSLSHAQAAAARAASEGARPRHIGRALGAESPRRRMARKLMQ